MTARYCTVVAAAFMRRCITLTNSNYAVQNSAVWMRRHWGLLCSPQPAYKLTMASGAFMQPAASSPFGRGRSCTCEHFANKSGGPPPPHVSLCCRASRSPESVHTHYSVLRFDPVRSSPDRVIALTYSIHNTWPRSVRLYLSFRFVWPRSHFLWSP